MTRSPTLPAWFLLSPPRTGTDGNAASAGHAVARGLALFLGAFIFSGLVARFRTPGFDPNLWWIDLRALPSALASPFLAGVGALLLAFSFRTDSGPARIWLTRAAVGLTVLALLANSAVVLSLFLRGDVRAGVPVPASLLFAAAFAFIGYQSGRPASKRSGRPLLLATALLCVGLFPVVQVLCFGRTDYRRPADMAVVFGARVYADGRLSDAVADRVRTAARLYREGWVSELVMSGGPGDGALHETTAMRAAAIRDGVPAAAIRVDLAGLSTAATVQNTAGQAAGRRVLAVSEYYHLPRIKLAYARAGVEVFTVPAQVRDWRRALDLRSPLREVPAFWLYYLRSLGG